ncbi:MAG: hypothetical protein HZR80_20955 [Candidatus Heimdallarchaeota archaeon]
MEKTCFITHKCPKVFTMFKAIELIPIIHILIYKYVNDDQIKEELLQLIADLVPRASREFLEHYELADPKYFVGS